VSLLTRFYWSAYLAYHLRGQAQYPFRDAEDIKRDQDRSVRRMVAHALIIVFDQRIDFNPQGQR
jgi:hypothetical protein